jgi:hypothetical protein
MANRATISPKSAWLPSPMLKSGTAKTNPAVRTTAVRRCTSANPESSSSSSFLWLQCRHSTQNGFITTRPSSRADHLRPRLRYRYWMDHEATIRICPRPFPLEPGSLPPGRSPQDPGGRPAQSLAYADGLAIHDDGQGAVRDRSATGVRTRRPQMGRAGPPRPPLRRSRYTRLTAKTTPSPIFLAGPNPGEWSPGLGSAQPIAQRLPEGDLDAVAASWTIGSEEDGPEQLPADSG